MSKEGGKPSSNLELKAGKFTEGPCVNAQGEVYFNAFPEGKAYKIGLDGKVSEFLAGANMATGQAVAGSGEPLSSMPAVVGARLDNLPARTRARHHRRHAVRQSSPIHGGAVPA